MPLRHKVLIFSGIVVLCAGFVYAFVWADNYDHDTPVCDEVCLAVKSATAGLTTASEVIAEYEKKSCCRELAEAKTDLEVLASFKKKAYKCAADLKKFKNRGDGKPCGVGLEATLASVRRLLVIQGSSDDSTLDLLIYSFRSRCKVAESKRRLKEMKRQ